MWQTIDTGKRRAAANMELDAALLQDLQEEESCLLHLYDWEQEAATYGHFVDPALFLNLEEVNRHGLDLAKRPTGGGIVFHNCDLAFSVLVPRGAPSFSENPLDNYAFVNQRVVWAIEQMSHTKADLLPQDPLPLNPSCRSFCMAKPTKYDVMIDGKKIGGAAQRKTRFGYLHQGSISLGFLDESYLLDILMGGSEVIEGMRQNSTALLGSSWNQSQLEEARAELRNLLQRAFSTTFEG